LLETVLQICRPWIIFLHNVASWAHLMLRIFTGAHTVGVSECQFFVNRLYNFLGTGLPDPNLTRLTAITSATFVRKQLTPRTQLRVATCRWTSGHSLDGTGATSGT
jgi:hypothetical protein